MAVSITLPLSWCASSPLPPLLCSSFPSHLLPYSNSPLPLLSLLIFFPTSSHFSLSPFPIPSLSLSFSFPFISFSSRVEIYYYSFLIKITLHEHDHNLIWANVSIGKTHRNAFWMMLCLVGRGSVQRWAELMMKEEERSEKTTEDVIHPIHAFIKLCVYITYSCH